MSRVWFLMTGDQDWNDGSVIGPEQVTALLRAQAPDWADLPVQALQTSGTDNAMFRLGAGAVLRVAKRPSAVPLLAKELQILPRLHGLPLQTPQVLFATANAEPQDRFGLFKWIDGNPASLDQIKDPQQGARDLGEFLNALRDVGTYGGPIAGNQNHNRGVALDLLTGKVLSDIESLADELDTKAARQIWNDACCAPPARELTWVHGDIKADNLLAKDGKLVAVIDWGLSAIGDRAVDLAAAWTWLPPSGRATFRTTCAATEPEWARAKGWALYAATVALAFYRGRSHEGLCAISRQTLTHLGIARLA